MDRYIFTQLLLPFLFGVGAFSSIVLAVGGLFDIVRKIAEVGLPISIAIEVMALKMPLFIVYSFPMSLLLAGMMTYGKFSADSEIIAFRSCGLSIYRLIAPAVVLSVLITGITFLFSESIVPISNQQAELTLRQALKQDKPTFNTDNIVKTLFKEVDRNGKKEQVLEWLFYAEKFDGKTMTGLTIIDRSEQAKGMSRIINAKSAVLDTNKGVGDFYDGTIYQLTANDSVANILNFKHLPIPLPKFPLDFTTSDKNPDNMNIAESLEYLEQIKLGGDKKKIIALTVKIQSKLAFPFICVVFGLMGSAMGIRPQRTGKTTSFGVSVLLIFGYYFTIFICESLGQGEVISPFLAGWLPNTIGIAIDGWLLAQAAK